jgi:hypothetical protein
MKIACLIIGNLWLIILLVLMLGKTVAGPSTDPQMYTFFNVRQPHTSSVYNALEGICLFIAAVHFILAFLTHRKS